MNLAPIVKLVRAYDAAEWEIFIAEWQKGLQGYASVKRLGGPGDHGRDVIGLCGSDACQGVWDNFQCKHYETPLSTPKACEDLICYVFGLVPGIAITHRNEMNVFDTEEIDVALWNDKDPTGFRFLPELILVECKSWSTNVGSEQVNWFDSKLRNRGLDFGILVATRGITGSADDLTRAHSIIAGALREKRRLIVITTAELMTLADTDALAHLLKQKMCEMAVKGSIC